MSINRWMILELSEQGISLSYSEIVACIKELFGDDVDFFLPVRQEKMGSYTSTCSLFDGYAFIRDGEKTRSCLINLKDFRAFSKVLSCRGHIQTVDSNAIGVLKRKLDKALKKSLGIGSKVKVLEGVFSNLVGEVVGIDDGGKKITVKIKTLSREMIAPVPSTSIEEIPA